MSSWLEKLKQNLPPSSPLAPRSNQQQQHHGGTTHSLRHNQQQQKQQQPRRRRSSLNSAASPLLLLYVFEFLSARELALKSAQVCRAWRNVVHEPVTWRFAWPAYQVEVECGFGRECYDPLPQLLRLAGFSHHQSCIHLPFHTTMNTDNNNNNKLWQSFEARGGPGLLSESEVEYIFSISTKRQYDDRYKAIVKSGAYRLRYVLSLLIHSHELRRDLTFSEQFGHVTFCKKYLRRRFLRHFIAQRKTEERRVQREQQRRRELLEGREAGGGADDGSRSADALTNASATPFTTPPVSPPLGPAANAAASIVARTQETADPPIVFTRNKTTRVRCLTFVDKIQWEEWLGATQIAVSSQDEDNEGDVRKSELFFDDGHDDDDEYEAEEEEEYCEFGDSEGNNNSSRANQGTTSSAIGNEDANDFSLDGPSKMSSSRRAPSASKDTVGSLTALETLQTLRSSPSPSVLQLSAVQALNIFSHLHAGAPLSSSCPVSIVDSTDCVDVEDDELLTDIAALMLGEQPFQEVSPTTATATTMEGSTARPGQQKQSAASRRSRKVRLVEVTLKLADDIIKSAATKPKERDSALQLLADFALRPLARYHPPCSLDQVDWTMRLPSVGRSNNSNNNNSTSSNRHPQNSINDSKNNNNNNPNSSTSGPRRKFSFLNAESDFGGTRSRDDNKSKNGDGEHDDGNNDDDDDDDDDDEDDNNNLGAGELEATFGAPIANSELSLSESLSLLCAPKFFSGPELCGEHSISVLVVDPMRLCLVKLRA